MNSQLVNVGNQDVRGSGHVAVLARFKGSAAVKEINDGEVIEVKGVLSDHQWRCLIQQERDRDVTGLLEAGGAIDFRSFVEVLGDALQDTGTEEEDIGTS